MSEDGENTMAKIHINVRVDSANIDRVDEIAEQQQTSRSAVVDKLLALGLQKMDEGEGGGESPEIIAAMQAHIITLHEQLNVKDEQIARLNKTADQAQELQLNLIRALPAASPYVETRAYADTRMEATQYEGQEAPQDARQPQEGPQDAHTAPGRPQEGETAPGGREDSPQKKKGFWASLWS